jgi:hypothetical protein
VHYVQIRAGAQPAPPRPAAARRPRAVGR